MLFSFMSRRFARATPAFCEEFCPVTSRCPGLNRCLVALAFVASTWLPAFGQDDLTGEWVISVDPTRPDSALTATIKHEGESVTGSVDSPLGRLPFSGTYVGGALSVNYVLPLPGQPLEALMTGNLDGETMTGHLVLGGLGQIPWTARRKSPAEIAAEAAAREAAFAAEPAALDVPVPADANGRWDIVLKLQGQGELSMSATLTQTDDQVSGTMRAPTGEAPITGTMVDKVLKISFSVQTPLGPMPVAMTGELGAQGFAGKAMVLGFGEADWVGRPAQK
jgi:hypothetical protein